MQQAIIHLHQSVFEYPVLAVRGGTSTGLVLEAGLVPEDEALRDELLRHLMGVPLYGENPGNKQTTGLGRGTPTSNKVFIVGTENHDGRLRLVSTLAQLAAYTSAIDWSVNCGNLSSILPLWAYDAGLLQADPVSRELWVDIRNTNTGVITRARMRLTDEGHLHCSEIPGVDGSWPAVDLFLQRPVGAKTGQLLPTGLVSERVEGVEVSCVDVAVPMVLIRASDLGKTAHESVSELEADPVFMAALRRVWITAALRMQLKNREGRLLTSEEIAKSETVPKVAILGPGMHGGALSVRYFTPQKGHASLAVSGGCCIASACLIDGSVPQKLSAGVAVPGPEYTEFGVNLENPAGVLTTTVIARQASEGLDIDSAAYQRSAQILQRGMVPLYRASLVLRRWLGIRAS